MRKAAKLLRIKVCKLSKIVLESIVKCMTVFWLMKGKFIMPVIKTIFAKTAAFMKGKGTFVALAACIAAVGGAGIYAYNRTVDTLNSSLTAKKPETSSRAELPAEAPTDSVLKDDSLTSELEAISKVQPRVFPTSGEILVAFSNGELVYNETLGAWEAHNGIDIAAENGCNIAAMTSGVVSNIWEDPLWGCCVEIDHQNSVYSYYYGLSQQLAVTRGDRVDSGDVIGTAGNTATAEIALSPHIHFALKRNGEWIDPVQFITPTAEK